MPPHCSRWASVHASSCCASPEMSPKIAPQATIQMHLDAALETNQTALRFGYADRSVCMAWHGAPQNNRKRKAKSTIGVGPHLTLRFGHGAKRPRRLPDYLEINNPHLPIISPDAAIRSRSSPGRRSASTQTDSGHHADPTPPPAARRQKAAYLRRTRYASASLPQFSPHHLTPIPHAVTINPADTCTPAHLPASSTA